jgi:hypothetical protein
MSFGMIKKKGLNLKVKLKMNFLPNLVPSSFSLGLA